MSRSLLEDIIKIHHLKTKRHHIQRKVVFSEPVMSLSLRRIAENEVLERKNTLTDNMGLITELEELTDKEIDMMTKAGYTNISDISNTDKTQISKEVNLPWRAIREMSQMVDGQTGFSFGQKEIIEENLTKDEAVEKLMLRKDWVNILLFEHRLRSECVKQAKQIMSDSDESTRKNLIKQLYDSKRRAEAHTKKIARFTRCSEQYVKDVIKGRIDEGLSKSERQEILDRDSNKCRKCGSEDELEVHHIIPVSQGGTKDDKNLCTLCSECHLNIAHGGKTAQVTYDSRNEFWNIIENSKI